MFNKILKSIDKKLCIFFGLDQQAEITPTNVELWRDKILISCTESHKRHRFIRDWDNFKKHDFNLVNKQNKNKLGVALGKVIAKDLVIDFNKSPIKSVS